MRPSRAGGCVKLDKVTRAWRTVSGAAECGQGPGSARLSPVSAFLEKAEPEVLYRMGALLQLRPVSPTSRKEATPLLFVRQFSRAPD